MPITNQQAFGMVDMERRGDPILTEFAAREAERKTRQLERALRIRQDKNRTVVHPTGGVGLGHRSGLGAALGRTAAYNGVKYDEKPHEESLLPEQPPPP